MSLIGIRYLPELQTLNVCYLLVPQVGRSTHPGPLSLGRGPPPLNLISLHPYLVSHPDQQFAAYTYFMAYNKVSESDLTEISSI